MKLNTKTYAKIARIFSIVVIAIILIYALFSYFGPFGSTKLAIVFNSSKLPAYVTETIGLDNAEKNLKTGQTYRRVTGFLAQLKIKVFKTFNNLNVKVKYENQNTNFVMASIALKSPFKYKPTYKNATKILENKLFDNLDWYRIADKNQSKILYQKGDDICEKKVKELQSESDIDPVAEYENCALMYDKDSEYLKEKNPKKNWVNYDYEDVGSFMNDIPNLIQKEKICTFNIDGLNDLAKVPDYSPASSTNSFDYQLNGFTIIKTYLANEDLDFNFDYQDLNTLQEKSDFNIFIFRGDEKILEKNISDDGNEKGDEVASAIKNLSVTIPNLKEGFYNIYLDASDDIVFDSLITKQKYWAFVNNIKLLDPEKSVDLYSNSGNMSFTALRDSALQTVTITKEKGMVTEFGPEFQKKELDIIKIDKPYIFNRNIYSKIFMPKADLNIDFNNLIATNMESLQALNVNNLINFSDFAKFNKESCNYIISDYFEKPEEKNGTTNASADFDVNNLYLDEKNNFNLLLIFPQYNRNDAGDVKINRIDLKYSR
ncbi:MAG: hypothetical protein WC663_02790 [Patescibacteria group bacterium]|jgi:hypothetical protein